LRRDFHATLQQAETATESAAAQFQERAKLRPAMQQALFVR
jgi:hypothetical protein